jgi:uridine phosphorylase
LAERTRADRPVIEGKMYHIALGPGDIPPYVLLPGDPDRVDKIAATWDSYEIITRHREYKSARGTYRGAPIAALSTGIGGPSTAIAVEELAQIGAHTLLRVGTTGALQRDIKPGDLVIGSAAVRYDCASSEYTPPEYPAAASPEAVLALVEAAERLGVHYHVGVVASTATFHLGQSRPGYRGYTWSMARERIRDLQAMGVLSFEMEAATIYTLASLYGLRAACVCAAIANRVTNEFVAGAGVEDAIRVANEAARILWRLDQLRGGYRPTAPSISLLARAAQD